MFDKLLFQNQVSMDIKDRYVPDYDEVAKPSWKTNLYISAQIDNNKVDVMPVRATWNAPATTFPINYKNRVDSQPVQ